MKEKKSFGLLFALTLKVGRLCPGADSAKEGTSWNENHGQPWTSSTQHSDSAAVSPARRLFRSTPPQEILPEHS